jgi:hypothetical protein
MFDDPDCTYHAERACDEAIRSIIADTPAAAAIHQELCLLHCGRVLAALFGR